MLTTQRLDSIEKSPGAEPLPGYRLIAPLGRGGFGEVWKCEAPGGLQKAIKFVAADGERFRQELAAFEQIKAIRHPFLLGLDRVELSGGELVMVMELADCQLHDRFRVCQAEGLPGIPRDELVGYLEEAAESLDMIGARYGLQHLDVKPANLFVVAGHAKIGDYGLVRRAERTRIKDEDQRGFTPRYTAPEVLLGRVDTRSDQYSLALVYCELLTGCFPYSGRTPQQLMMQHLSTPPDLSKLTKADRSVVGRALAKEPAERFPSCSAFVVALSGVSAKPIAAPVNSPALPDETTVSPDTPRPGSDPTLVMNAKGLPSSLNPTNFTPLEVAPGLESANPVNQEETTAVSRGPTPFRSSRPTQTRANLRRTEPPPADPFAGLHPVMPVSSFHGTTPRGSSISSISSEEFVNNVIHAAREYQAMTSPPSEEREGVLVSRFLCTLPFSMVPLKLALVAERWRLVVQQTTGTQITLWREYRVESRKTGKSEVRSLVSPPRSGLEVIVRSPTPPSAEITVVGSLQGMPDDDFAKKAYDDLPGIVEQIRSQLQNLAERRGYPRFYTNFQVRVYPLYPDGVVGDPIGGRCQDVSMSGIRLLTPVPVRTERVYVEFNEIEAIAGEAVYVRVLRTSQDPETQGSFTAGRFRIRREE